MKTPIPPNAERSARVFGCTVEQAKRLMAKNACGLGQMAAKARKTGRKVNGYSLPELERSEDQYTEAASLPALIGSPVTPEDLP